MKNGDILFLLLLAICVGFLVKAKHYGIASAGGLIVVVYALDHIKPIIVNVNGKNLEVINDEMKKGV